MVSANSALAYSIDKKSPCVKQKGACLAIRYNQGRFELPTFGSGVP